MSSCLWFDVESVWWKGRHGLFGKKKVFPLPPGPNEVSYRKALTRTEICNKTNKLILHGEKFETSNIWKCDPLTPGHILECWPILILLVLSRSWTWTKNQASHQVRATFLTEKGSCLGFPNLRWKWRVKPHRSISPGTCKMLWKRICLRKNYFDSSPTLNINLYEQPLKWWRWLDSSLNWQWNDTTSRIKFYSKFSVNSGL
jgi:hypothetical protein